MAMIRLKDAAGEGVDLVDIDGYHIAPFNNQDVTRSIFDNMANFKCREDDVFICAPPKSGTHWSWEITSMLLNGKAETIPKPKTDHMLDFQEESVLSEVTSPRVLNSHLNVHLLPRELIQKKCKIIYVIRNPKDLAVSFFNHMRGINVYHYSGRWEEFLPLFLQGELEYNCWFEYVRQWEKFISDHPEYPIHLVYYEDLKEDNLTEVARLARFLGVSDTDGLYEAVSAKCQIGNMRKDKALPPEVHKVLFKGDYTMFRKGDIGDWKNWFTVAQSEHFDKIYAKKMEGSSYTFRYSYSK